MVILIEVGTPTNTVLSLGEGPSGRRRGGVAELFGVNMAVESLIEAMRIIANRPRGVFSKPGRRADPRQKRARRSR